MTDSDKDNNLEILLVDLEQHANNLIEAVKRGDLLEANEIIHLINDRRDDTLYQEVGKLTRGLHNAIRDFKIDPSNGALSEKHRSEMVDANDNLSYVINLTEKAADKTMDMVEEGMPIASQMAEEARFLLAEWRRLVRREMEHGEFKELSRRLQAFLIAAEGQSAELNDKFNAILMAQDFQDLTGQVIKRVMALVEEVEGSLVNLMRIAGKVDEITGIKHTATEASVPDKIEAEGPVINPGQRAGVVSNQDEVDDLLSSLGF